MCEEIVMKVRWTKSSIRLRITPEELERLRRGDLVEEELLLGGVRVWQVKVAYNARTELRCDNGDITFHLSRADIHSLCEPGREGVYFSQDGVRFYIEKDFPCAHPRAGEAEETPTETFAPPSGFEERKNQ